MGNQEYALSSALIPSEMQSYWEFRAKKRCDLTFYVTRFLRLLPLEYIEEAWMKTEIVSELLQ